PSDVDRMIVRGTVIGSGAGTSSVVAADNIGHVHQTGGTLLVQRTYDDLLGAPEIVDVIVDDGEIHVIFSEVINTASLRAMETEGDGGTVILRQPESDPDDPDAPQPLVTDLILSHSVRVADDGTRQSRLVIERAEGLPDGQLQLTLGG